MSNGFYRGYPMEKGTLTMMCVGELCWKWVEDELGMETLMIDPNMQMLKLIEAGGGLFGTNKKV